jgi:hypothetical protein
MRSTCFLVSLKTIRMVFSGLTSKLVALFSLFWPQNRWLGFSGVVLKIDSTGLELKITATVSWLGPQNQAGFGLSVVPQNRWREDGTGHASRSDSLLRLEASRVRISQSGLKIGRDVMTGGTRGKIMEVASRSS